MTEEEALAVADRAIEAMKSFGVTPAMDRYNMAALIRSHVATKDQSFQSILGMLNKGGKPS